MTKESGSKPSRYGPVFILAALGLGTWLIAHIMNRDKTSTSEIDKQIIKLQQEIEGLQSQLERTKLELKRTRIDQRDVHRNVKELASVKKEKLRKKAAKGKTLA